MSGYVEQPSDKLKILNMCGIFTYNAYSVILGLPIDLRWMDVKRYIPIVVKRAPHREVYYS